MGCGSSSPMPQASGGDLPKKPPRKKESKLEKGDLNIDTGISDGLAAGTALAGAGALLAGATSSEARGGMGSAAGAVGSALLSFAKQLPWVAPIAFVVAGVAQAAADVHALKRDAQIFAANVRSAENIMMQVAKKGKLGAVQETCEMLKFEMEEGLAFCHKLKTKYFVSQMLTSGRDCEKFKDISDSIQRQLTVIAAAASVETHDIITDEFEQGQALKDKIAELGGAAAVAADPELKAQCAEFMKASDELIVSAVDEVARAVKLEAEKSQKKMDDMMEQSRAQTKVLEDQVANLTKMMEVLLQQRLGGRASTPRRTTARRKRRRRRWKRRRRRRRWTRRRRSSRTRRTRRRRLPRRNERRHRRFPFPLTRPSTTPTQSRGRFRRRWTLRYPAPWSATSCRACLWRTPRRSASRWFRSTG